MQIAGINVDSLHITPEVVAEILRDAHAQGTLPHHWMLDLPGRVLEVALGATQRCWIGTDLRSGIGRKPTVAHPLMAAAPIAFNLRASGTLADQGICGTGTINLAVLMTPPINRGSVPAKFENSIRLDFSPTTGSDITLFAAQAIPEQDVRNAMLAYVKLVFSGTYPLPTGLNESLRREGAVHVTTSLSPVPQVIVRKLEIPRDEKGRRIFSSDPPVGVLFGPQEGASWQVVATVPTLGIAFLRLGEAVQRLMWKGSSADDNAASPPAVKALDGAISITENHAGKKSARAIRLVPQSVYAGKLMCSLADSARSIPLRANAQAIDLIQALRGNGAAEADNRLDRPFGFRLRASLLQCDVRGSGLKFRGTAFRDTAQEVPVSDFTWYRMPGSVDTVTFYAMTSWSPASDIVAAEWDFGDGTVLSSSGQQLALVASHAYPRDGIYACTLKVTDSAGRQASSRQNVELGALRFVLATPRVQLDGRLTTRLRVTSGNTPAAGAQFSFPGHPMQTLDGDGFVIIDDSDAVPFGVVGISDGTMVRLGAAATAMVTWVGRQFSADMTVVDRATYLEIVRTTQICNRTIGSLSRFPRTDGSAHLASLAEKTKRALRLGQLPAWYCKVQVKDRAARVSSSAEDIASAGRHIADSLAEKFFL